MTVDLLGDQVVLDSIIDRSITEFVDDSLLSLGNGAFRYCSNLTKIVLHSNTLCSLPNIYVLSNTPIANGTGFIYVNDDLVETYKSATNWTTYANQIKPISELGG